MAKKSIKPAARALVGTVETAGGALRTLTIMDLKELLGSALIDPTFRRQLLTDAPGVLIRLGIQPTPGAQEFFNQLRDGNFTDAADLIDTNGVPRPPVIDFTK